MQSIGHKDQNNEAHLLLLVEVRVEKYGNLGPLLAENVRVIIGLKYQTRCGAIVLNHPTSP